MDEIKKHRLIATFFGVGYFPVAPGTAGSLAALPVVAALVFAGRFLAGPWLAFLFLLTAAAVTLYFGIPAVSGFSRKLDPQVDKSGRKRYRDHGIFVIDEVLGMLVSALPLCLLDPATGRFWLGLAVAFALFRVFDILKPWPISQIDKHDRSFNVMMDDALAGLLAAVLTWLLMQLF